MTAVVCYSGGHSSALVAIEAARKYGSDNVILLNHDISSTVEHEDIKRFKVEVADYLGVPITYANAENFEEMTPLAVAKMKAGFSGNGRDCFCTWHLKTEPFRRWLKENFPADEDSPRKDIRILYGFDPNEKIRVLRRAMNLRNEGYRAGFPLCVKPWKRTIYSTEEIGITRPSTYKIWKHANCMGCLKAGKQHWYVVFCLRPDIFEEAVQAEAELGYSIILCAARMHTEREPRMKVKYVSDANCHICMDLYPEQAGTLCRQCKDQRTHLIV